MTKIKMEQDMNLFSLPQFHIDKPIRLIELFGGIGSQAMALRNIGADFEHYRLVEFDKHAVASYNAIHETHFVPQDITKITGKDLGVVDAGSFTYLLTYSFPCQDLSVAGKQLGMAKGEGTRSGLLWEVERLLNQVENLPQVLLMENVPQVHGKNNMTDFTNWVNFLNGKGYFSYSADLNAKDFGVAQNRERCFMVSIFGAYDYDFPDGFKLDKTMKDYLEPKIDEKYYINTDRARKFIEKLLAQGVNTERECISLSMFNPERIDVANCILARDRGIVNRQKEGNGVLELKQNERTQKEKKIGNIYGFTGGNYAGNVYDKDYICSTLSTMQGTNRQPIIVEEKQAAKQYRIRKLTPRECWRLMGFSDADFDKAAAVNTDAQLYKQAGNSIVVTVLEAIFRQMCSINWE